MVTGDATAEEASDLADRPRDTDLALGFFVFPAGFQLLDERRRDLGLAEAAKPTRLLQRQHGHDAGQNRYGNAGRPSAGDEAEVVFVIQEELRGDEVGTSGDLTRQVTDVR